MTVEEAITTALEHEKRVEQTYREAEQHAEDPVAKKVFKTLADEELGHIEFLKCIHDKFKETGKVSLDKLETVVPSKARIDANMARLQDKMTQNKELSTNELTYLQKALEVELTVSNFYRGLVSELTDEAQQLFQRFVEIEEGHVAIVQAELDSVSGLGYWFDIQEWQFQDG